MYSGAINIDMGLQEAPLTLDTASLLPRKHSGMDRNAADHSHAPTHTVSAS